MGKKLIILLCLLSGTNFILSQPIAEAIEAVTNFKTQIDSIKKATGFVHAAICSKSQDFREAATSLRVSGVTANAPIDPVEGLRTVLATAHTEANGTSALINNYRELTDSVLEYLNNPNSEAVCKRVIASAFNTTAANLLTHVQSVKKILDNPTEVKQLLSIIPARPLPTPPITPVGPQPPPVPPRGVADPKALEQAMKEAETALTTTTDGTILEQARTRLLDALTQYQADRNIKEPKLIRAAQELLAKFPAPRPPLRGGLERALSQLASNLQALHTLIR